MRLSGAIETFLRLFTETTRADDRGIARRGFSAAATCCAHAHMHTQHRLRGEKKGLYMRASTGMEERRKICDGKKEEGRNHDNNR